MKAFLKKAVALALSLLIAAPLVSAGVPASAETVRYGLTIADGVIQLNGKPFYGMGVNFYDAFLVNLRGNLDQTATLERDFKRLKIEGIPLARISMCGFGADEFSVYMNSRDYYFSCLDTAVSLAEKYQVGIIFDLCWWIDAIPVYAGEGRSAIGDTASETMRLAKSYVANIVSRYKASPAVWAWEIGNEYNLDADLSGVLTRPENQDVSSDDIEIYYRELASVIRSLDTYRLITGGDSEPRNAAYNLYSGNGWRTDTVQQTEMMMNKLSPPPMSMMSVHLYQWDSSSKITMSDINDFDSRVANYMRITAAAGQGLLIGEFGIMESRCASRDVAMAILDAQYNAMMKHSVQLSCIWVYAMTDDDQMNIMPFNSLSYQWNKVVEGNRAYRADGKQDTAAYWNAVTPMIQNSGRRVLYDGQAEHSLAGYRTWVCNSGTVAVDTATLHNGKSSLKMTATTTDITDVYIENMTGTLPAGTRLRLSAYFKTESYSGIAACFKMNDNGAPATAPTGTSDWIYSETEITLSDAVTNPKFTLTAQWHTGTLWVQGAKIELLYLPEDPETLNYSYTLYDSGAKSGISDCRVYVNDDKISGVGMDSAVLHNGKSSVKFSVSGTDTNVITDLNVETLTVSLPAGTKVKLSGWFRAQTLTNSIYMRLCGTGGYQPEMTVPSGTYDWTYYEQVITLSRELVMNAADYSKWSNIGNGLLIGSQWHTGDFWAEGAKITVICAPDGDVNGDGRADSADLVTVRNYLLTGTGVFDINRDGKSDIADIVRLKKLLA